MKNTRLLIHATLLLLVFVSSSRAEYRQIGPNAYVVGIRTEKFTYFAAPDVVGRQRQQNWCWAACVQMVLNYHGLYVTQEEVVQHVFGRLVDRPANQSEIMMALSGLAPDFRGRASAITTFPSIGDQSLIADLAHDYPLIAGVKNEDGVSGHAYVVTALQFHTEAYVTHYWYGRPVYGGQRRVLDFVTLRDPWPSNDSKQVWPWAKFQSRLISLNRVFPIRL